MKAKAILGEAIEHSPSLKNTTQLLPVESQWLDQIDPKHKLRSWPAQSKFVEWEIKLDEPEFINWKASLNEIYLFFDGASKGNPSKARGGGVFVSPAGTVVSSYA